MNSYEQQSEVLPLEAWALGELVERHLMPAFRVCAVSGGTKRHWRTVVMYLWHGFDLFNRRVGSMPRNGKNANFDFEGWVNVRLTDDDKQAIVEMHADDGIEQLAQWIAQMNFEGYSFSASWDDYSDAIQVSLVCKNAEDVNYGLGMSSRHPDFDMAVASLRYKHEVVTREDWTEYRTAPRMPSWG